MFPVYVYEEGMELPKRDAYFVVAANGIFLHKDNGLFEGFVQVDRISCLDEFSVDCRSTTSLSKIPHSFVMKIRKFFALVFEKYCSEACVLLYYNQDERTYLVVAPEQQVSRTAVIYRREPISEAFGFQWCDYQLIGTIHSHCDFSAFHSAVDDDDEKTFDGLHLTFGHVDRVTGMSVSASIVLNGQRTTIDPLSVLEGVTCNESVYTINPPSVEMDYDSLQGEVDSWMEKVNRR